ncbi:MAG: DNA primase [Eubacteriales bacterium]
MIIRPEIIEDIKSRNDIETVISSYVRLKRAGSNLNGLCPFHSEKTPSFTVFPATQSFYCFGCGAGGDVITFVMRTENVDYVTAVRILAERSGITIPDENVSSSSKGVSRQRILDMNREAAKFFHAALLDEKTGAEARRYLLDERKLSMAVVNHFGLGYAPNSFGAVHDHLKKAGFTDEEMITGFLCGKSKNGTAYDYFRNRVIFPIIDVSGNVVAFGGRVMDNSLPKYLNTSDTPAFKKSKNLFALNFAKDKCADMLILCEGYMDVIALHAAGFEFAVATLGTAITQEQARIFSRYTKKVVISYDSDEAGQRAADKAFKYLQEVGLDVKILKMNGAKDPDEYIKKFGSEKFATLLDDSKSRFEFEIEKILSKYDIANTDEKVKASYEICGILSTFTSEVEREVYAQKVSEILKIPKQSILKDVERIMRKKNSDAKKNFRNEIYRNTSGFADRVNPESVSNMKACRTEEAILGLMQLKAELLKKAVSELTADDFVTSFNKKVFEKISEAYKEYGKFDIAFISDSFSVDETSRVTKMLVTRERLENNGEEIMSELIKSLKEEKSKENTGSIDDILDIISRKKQED